MNTNTITTVESQSVDTLNSVLIDVLRGAKDVGGELYGASKGAVIKMVDFANEQAPIVVEEFLKWKFFESLSIGIILGLLALIILIIGYRIFKKCEDDIFGRVVTAIVTFFVFLFAGIPSSNHLLAAAKVKIAPRVYLIEYVSDLVKTGKK